VLSIICINSEVPIVHVLRQFHKVAGEVTTPLLLMTSLPLQIILYLDHKVAAILWTNDLRWTVLVHNDQCVLDVHSRS